jgi:uncharacterized metal-binding protein
VSSGKIHNKIIEDFTIPIYLFILILFYLINPDCRYSFIYAWFVKLGIYIAKIASPDVDVDNGFYGFFLIKKNFGERISKIYQWYWKPYAGIVEHRSWVSHSFIISTTIRYIYLFWWLGILVIIKPEIFYYYDFFLASFLATILADGLHLLLDYILPFRNFYEGLHGRNKK